ncbi:MAG: hypothetical protein ACI35K_01735, partial [Campylobacter sp.]
KIIIQKLEFTKSPKAWANSRSTKQSAEALAQNIANSGAVLGVSVTNYANNGGNSSLGQTGAPQNYNQAPQAPQQYGNYDHMPDTVTNAVERHNAEWQAQNTAQNTAQNLAQELDEIPF